MLEHSLGTSHVFDTRAWEDARDASVAGVDITLVQRLGGAWYLELAERPPRGRSTAEVVSYGLVFDTTKDGAPDHLVGIEDDPTPPGDVFPGNEPFALPPHLFRVWVTDLATGKTDEQIGPPYGYPIEFGHPDERGEGARMWFTFLGDSAPAHMKSVRFYAWASLTTDGEIVAWDVAPDEGWMTVGDR
jgi:hypothetical protein